MLASGREVDRDEPQVKVEERPVDGEMYDFLERCGRLDWIPAFVDMGCITALSLRILAAGM